MGNGRPESRRAERDPSELRRVEGSSWQRLLTGCDQQRQARVVFMNWSWLWVWGGT